MAGVTACKAKDCTTLCIAIYLKTISCDISYTFVPIHDRHATSNSLFLKAVFFIVPAAERSPNFAWQLHSGITKLHDETVKWKRWVDWTFRRINSLAYIAYWRMVVYFFKNIRWHCHLIRESHCDAKLCGYVGAHRTKRYYNSRGAARKSEKGRKRALFYIKSWRSDVRDHDDGRTPGKNDESYPVSRILKTGASSRAHTASAVL